MRHSLFSHLFHNENYANVDGLRKHGNASMPLFEDKIANSLSMGETSMLKTPTLQSKPLRMTSRSNSRPHEAVGQAGGDLHMMAMLQVYQADLLKNLEACPLPSYRGGRDIPSSRCASLDF